jgi:hypothetical protein
MALPEYQPDERYFKSILTFYKNFVSESGNKFMDHIFFASMRCLQSYKILDWKTTRSQRVWPFSLSLNSSGVKLYS